MFSEVLETLLEGISNSGFGERCHLLRNRLHPRVLFQPLFCLILRNHGLLSVGKTVGEAFVFIYRIETACRHQIDAMSGGAELQDISAATQQKSIDMGLSMYGPGGFIEVGKEWPMLLRQLERAGMDDYAR